MDRLKLAIDQKRPALFNRIDVVFHQDNARPYTSIVTRQNLWELGWEVLMRPPYSGKSRRNIAKSAGRQNSSIQHVIYNFISTRVYTSKPHLDRPSKLTIREKRNTARKILKKAGYQSRVVRRKPYISVTSRFKRIAFEKDHIHKPLEFWKTEIFCDEGIFCILGIKGRKLVWRDPCTVIQKEHLVPMLKHGGGGVMVCGCMASNDVGKVEYI
ncbi:transposable element Tc1 transposase [Trichonephila clavipes]|uniref:Transposable element Tc1 transposase n=1 Tax=Trichonephila clavipes TaxID=2585209 RepID=A0A8X6R2X5_TRICX|nr:transposable element Tc1 transposase [Trichonephila clavipes]